MSRRKWALLAIILAALALRLWCLDAQSLWWDEMVTVFRSTSPPALMWEDILRPRNQVPLHYLLMRPWMALGHGAFWTRYISAWWGVLTIALIFRLGQELAGGHVGLIAALLLTFSPMHVWYSQEGRMYTLLGALTLLCYLQLLRLMRDPNNWMGWLLYGLALLAALSTHYFTVFMFLAQAIPMLLHRRRRPGLFWRWALVVGIVGLVFSPWLVLTMQAGGFRQSPIASWIDEARWYEPLLTLYTFGLGSTANLMHWWNWLAYGALLVALGWGTRLALRQLSSSLEGQTLVNWLLLPLFLMWTLSVRVPGLSVRRSVYMDRYVTWLLPVFALLVAWGWQRWRHRHWSAWATAVLYGICLLISLNTLYSDSSYAREDWRSTVTNLNRLAADDAVLVSRPGQRLPLWYYPPSASITIVELSGSVPEESLVNWLGLDSPPDELWLITSRENTNPHVFPAERNRALDAGAKFDGLKTELDARYPIKHRLRFPGIILSCYRLEGTVGG